LVDSHRKVEIFDVIISLSLIIS